MKRLFLAAFAVGLIGCANQPAPPAGPAVAGNYPYSRWAYSTEAWGYPAPAYGDWATARLHERRLELYGMDPLTRTRPGVPGYTYHGQALASQNRSHTS